MIKKSLEKTVTPAKGRIIKAQDMDQWQDANTALLTAQKILKNAEQEAVTLKQAAYDEGLLQGRKAAAMENAQRLVDMQKRLREEIDKLEVDLAKAVIAGIKKILAEVPADMRIEQVVRKIILQWRGKHEAVLMVSPADKADAKKAVERLSKQRTASETLIQIEESDTLDKGRILITGPVGIIDLSIHRQIDRLNTTLEESL